jgi:hypothetical protein
LRGGKKWGDPRDINSGIVYHYNPSTSTCFHTLFTQIMHLEFMLFKAHASTTKTTHLAIPLILSFVLYVAVKFSERVEILPPHFARGKKLLFHILDAVPWSSYMRQLVSNIKHDERGGGF